MKKLLIFLIISFSLGYSLADAYEFSKYASFLGPTTGIIHPFVGLTGFYTDNVYNRHEETKSAFGGIVSPGIWIGFPHVKKPMLRLKSTSMTPGGVSLTRVTRKNFRRFQGLLSYKADIWRYDGEGKADKTEHFLTGVLEYNMPIGLSAEIIGAYIKAHDEWGETLRTSLSPYESAYGGLRLLYDLSKKTKLRFDLRYYDLNYKKQIDDYRDRNDFIVSPYFYYSILPKTSVFFQYKFTEISYDKNKVYDSSEHHFYGGVKWKISGKTKGELKGGYALKQYTNADVDTASYFVIKAKGDYRFNKKFWTDFSITRQSEETPIYGYKNVVTNEFKIKFNYKLTGKTSFHLVGRYLKESYDATSFYSYTKDRDDYTYEISPFVLWKYKPWVNTKLGYRYKRRDSNVTPYDYTANSVWLTVYFTL